MKWLGLVSTIGMLLILLGGSLVTKTDSGQGCGRNWPDCNGSLIPDEITMAVLIEFSHRAVTGSVAIFIFALTILTWFKLKTVREARFLAATALFFLVAQALIGAAQVLWPQGDFILALHFGISLISFASVLLLTLLIFETDRKFHAENVHINKKLKLHTVSLTLYSYCVVYSGALVRHTESSLICPDWPFCYNESIRLPHTLNEWIQMGHRTAAAIIFIWILYITIYVFKHYAHISILKYCWTIAFIIVTCQVIAGMLVVLTRMNLAIALIHSLCISLLFGLLCYLVLLISRSETKEKELSNKYDHEA